MCQLQIDKYNSKMAQSHLIFMIIAIIESKKVKVEIHQAVVQQFAVVFNRKRHS